MKKWISTLLTAAVVFTGLTAVEVLLPASASAATTYRSLGVFYADANLKGYRENITASPDQGPCDGAGYKRTFRYGDYWTHNLSSIGKLPGPGIRCNHVVVNTINYLGQVGSVCFSARLPVSFGSNRCNDSVGQVTFFFDGVL